MWLSPKYANQDFHSHSEFPLTIVMQSPVDGVQVAHLSVAGESFAGCNKAKVLLNVLGGFLLCCDPGHACQATGNLKIVCSSSLTRNSSPSLCKEPILVLELARTAGFDLETTGSSLAKSVS